MKSFIVNRGDDLFNGLRWISLFHIIYKIFPAIITYGFVEIWVLGNFFFSLIFLLISSCSQIRWWEILLLSYAALRIFEIVIYQINVLLFDQYRARRAGKKDDLRSYIRIIILLLFNYLEILFWFAIFYRNFDFMFYSRYISLNSFVGSLFFSLVTMSTLGYGDVTPISSMGMIITSIQTLLGIFIALVIIARFISLLPKPGTLEEAEKDEAPGGPEASRLRKDAKR